MYIAAEAPFCWDPDVMQVWTSYICIYKYMEFILGISRIKASAIYGVKKYGQIILFGHHGGLCTGRDEISCFIPVSITHQLIFSLPISEFCLLSPN